MKVEHYYYYVMSRPSVQPETFQKELSRSIYAFILQTIESMFHHLDYFIEGADQVLSEIERNHLSQSTNLSLQGLKN